jgi:hypothetical protein
MNGDIILSAIEWWYYFPGNSIELTFLAILTLTSALIYQNDRPYSQLRNIRKEFMFTISYCLCKLVDTKKATN